MMAGSIAPIHETVTVALASDQAFALFTAGFGAAGLASISLGMKSGDHCHEIGLVQVEPPPRLRILWQIAHDRTSQPDPAQASEIEVAFTPPPSG